MNLTVSRIMGAFFVLSFCTACVVQPVEGGDDAGANPNDPVACTGDRDCARDELCISGACTEAECQTDRQCRISEICDNGRCLEDTSCTSDRDCDIGFLCQENQCVRDTRQRCAQHADCPDTGMICDIMAGEAEGFCIHHTDVECVDDSECEFPGGVPDQANRPFTYTCEEGICKAGEKDGCTVSADCLTGKDCVAMSNGSRCLTPCAANADCGRFDYCEPNLNGHCWYNLCGNDNDLSNSFQGINNGALGGGCQADAPNAPSLPFCETDAECSDGERCNTELAECEKYCESAAECGGGDNPWMTCRLYDHEDIAQCDPNAREGSGEIMGVCNAGVGDAGHGDECSPESPCDEGGVCEGYQEAVEEILACDAGETCIANACETSCTTDGDCSEDTRCTREVAGGGFVCAPVSGICTHNQSDGHCLEVNAGEDEMGNPQWVGLCFEGGYLSEGAVCNPEEESMTNGQATRGNDGEQCSGGLICAGLNDSGDTTCNRTCAVGPHGTVNCGDDELCVGQFGVFGACIGNDSVCHIGYDTDSCGENARCGFFGWEMDDSLCMTATPEADRKAAGEACEATAECGDGAVCVGRPAACRVICRPNAENSAQCPNGTTCQTLASLTQGDVESAMGLCWQSQ